MTTNSGFWDKNAQRYAASPIKDTETYEKWLARTVEHLGPDDRVLEVGCGTGSTAFRFAPAVKTYLSTDFSAGMIEIADEKLKQKPVENLAFLQVDPFDRQLENAASASPAGFDAVLAFSFLHLTEDPEAMVLRLNSLLKPGGLFISKTVCLGSKKWLFAPIISIMRFFGKAPLVHMLTEKEIDELMEGGGFEVIDAQTYGSSLKSRYVVARKV